MALIPPPAFPLDRFSPSGFPWSTVSPRGAIAPMTRLQEETPPGGGIRSFADVAGVSCARSVHEDRHSTSARPGIPAASHGCQAAFLPDLTRVGEMRQTAGAFLRWCRVSEPVAGVVVLAVSELVTNAMVTVREKSCSGSRWPSTWCASRSPITIRPQLYPRKPDPTVNPVAGSGLSMRSQTCGRAAARRRGVSSGTRGLRVEPDFQLVPGHAVDESGSSVTSPTGDAPRAVRLPSPSSSVQASRQAMRADGSGPEAPSVRSTVPGRSRASRRRRRDR